MNSTKMLCSETICDKSTHLVYGFVFGGSCFTSASYISRSLWPITPHPHPVVVAIYTVATHIRFLCGPWLSLNVNTTTTMMGRMKGIVIEGGEYIGGE